MRFSNWKSRLISPGQSSSSVKDFDGNRYYLLRHSCVSSPTPLICCSSNLSSGTHLTPFASVTWFLANACTHQPHSGPRTWNPPPQIVAQLVLSLPSGLCSNIISSERPSRETIYILVLLVIPYLLYHSSPRIGWSVPRHRPTKRKQTKTRSAVCYHHALGLLNIGDGIPFWEKTKTELLLVYVLNNFHNYFWVIKIYTYTLS